MRDTTERPEAVSTGVVKLIGTCRERIVMETAHLLAILASDGTKTSIHNPYGDGMASNRIVKVLVGEI
jgi:UDP-N-acetylglucosamine 2-epimerase (non-hydrolysing)